VVVPPKPKPAKTVLVEKKIKKNKPPKKKPD